MSDVEEYFDADGVAGYLKMSIHTIRQYVSKKKIPYIKVPGSNQVRFPKSLIDNWMMGGKTLPSD